ncbi:MAG: hypothetical protein EA403_02075 [Spirochaetaceae bacterium]|nr:MAG: hypothetical protein EA403_02075 [Spirochaetaceae bacterium]
MQRTIVQVSAALCYGLLAVWSFGQPTGTVDWDHDHDPETITLSPYTELTATQDRLFDTIGFAAGYQSTFFQVFFDLALTNDGRYEPEEPYLLGHYFDLRQGVIAVTAPPFLIQAGRAFHRDEVASPYSLFISSHDISAPIVRIRYENRLFFYESRWIKLNQNSLWYRTPELIYAYPGYPSSPPIFDPDREDAPWTPLDDNPVWFRPLDRGANYKVYGVRIGDWRFGFQESVVYLNQSFYPEYFFSPLPMYFTQLVNSTPGKPWTQRDDENSHMGFFVERTGPESYAYLQFLMGDINLNFLTPDHDLSHPNKWAWSLGGTRDFDIGRIGVFHAGALKYTFAATTATSQSYSTKRYEYTYFPAVHYLFDGGLRAIDYRDNYIGYQYGENNLAFMTTYDATLNGYRVAASLEYVISGSKSPANPWHEERTWPGRLGDRRLFPLLDERPLEHTVRLETQIGRSVGPWEFSARAGIGAVFNELQLVPVPDRDDPSEDAEEPWIYRPSDRSRLLFSLALGARYRWRLPEGGALATTD